VLSDVKRFWSKVDIGGPDECWEWMAVRHPFGHGKIKVDGQYEYAHRVAYSLERGALGDDLVLHKCDNPPCVNPNHLYLGDHTDNIRDAYNRGQRSDSPLTKQDVVEIKRKLADGEKTQREIAEEFGVVRGCIANIATGRNWSRVEISGGDEA